MPKGSTSLMDLARAEAAALGHEFVGTEHLLLALAGLSDSPTGRVFAARGVSPGAIRTQIGRLTTPGLSEVPEDDLPCNPYATRALERAAAEARALGHERVVPTHLMLALLGDNGTVAATALWNLGVTPKPFRTDLLREAGWA